MNLSLLLQKHSIKMSQICMTLKQLAFLNFRLMYGNSFTTFVCLILARNYNSPRTISVKVLTLLVAAKVTLHVVKHLIAHNKQ